MRTQAPPPVDVPCPEGGCPYPGLGEGVPDLCVNGWTLVTLTACGPDNPTIPEACQNVEWRDTLNCVQYPLPRLPETGAGSVPIAGTGLAALLVGAVLLRVSSRRGVAHPARR